MLTFRHKLLISFLTKPHHHPSYDFVRFFLRKYRKLGIDRELLAAKLEPKFYCHLPTFQSELLRAWDTIGARFATLPVNNEYFVKLPINSNLFNAVNKDADGLVGRLATRGIRLVEDLLDHTNGTRIPPQYVKQSATTRLSVRCFTKDLQTIRSIIPKPPKTRLYRIIQTAADRRR